MALFIIRGTEDGPLIEEITKEELEKEMNDPDIDPRYIKKFLKAIPKKDDLYDDLNNILIEGRIIIPRIVEKIVRREI